MKVVYLSGPMSHHHDNNRIVFEHAKTVWLAQNVEVVSPVDVAQSLENCWNKDRKIEYNDYLLADLQAIQDNNVDTMIMLPGWEKSKGCVFEHAFALNAGIKIMQWPDKQSTPRSQNERICSALICWFSELMLHGERFDKNDLSKELSRTNRDIIDYQIKVRREQEAIKCEQ